LTESVCDAGGNLEERTVVVAAVVLLQRFRAG